MEDKSKLKKLIIFILAVIVVTVVGVLLYNKLHSSSQDNQGYLITNEVKVSTKSLTLNKGETKTFTITMSKAAGIIDIASSNNLVTVSSDNSDCNGTKCFYDAITDDVSIEYKVVGVETGDSQINITLSDVLTTDEKQVTGSSVIEVSVK